MESNKKLGRLDKDKVLFFQCDIQERFKGVIYCFDAVIDVAKMMAKASSTFKCPLVETEQYPKAFGKTVQEIGDCQGNNVHYWEKTIFSMVIPEVKELMEKNPERTQVVLYGIEAHVCVQQTCLDLLEMKLSYYFQQFYILSRGIEVFLLCDGISSSRPVDRAAAFRRMEQAGAILTSAESILFELLKDSKNENFKEVLGIVKMKRKQLLEDI